MNKKIIIIATGIILIVGLSIASARLSIDNTVQNNLGATILYPSGGGTGTSTNPSAGQMLVGDGLGKYKLAATSTLGLGGGGVGTVTSVGMTVPTGLTVSGVPITTAGTSTITLTAGYQIPTTTRMIEWDTAYTDRLKWDGGATGLTAATGRTSLELGTMALEANTGSTTITTIGTLDSLAVAGTTTLATTAGKVSIGTTTSTYALNVNGDVSLVGTNRSLHFAGTSDTIGWDGSNLGFAGAGTAVVKNTGGLIISNNLNMRGILSDASHAYLSIGGGTSGYTYFSGNVGIGTTSPSALLTVGATTSLQFLVGSNGVITATNFSGTSTGINTGDQAPSITIASSTWNSFGGTSGTTTIGIGFATDAETWASYGCYTDTATTTINFGDGTNWMTDYIASDTPSLMTVSSNNTFTALEKRYIRISRFTGTPNYVTCTVKKSVN